MQDIWATLAEFDADVVLAGHEDLASGDILVDASAGSDAGIDVVSSEFATIAAEQTALENLAVEVADRIVTRLTLTLRAQSYAWQFIATSNAVLDEGEASCH